MRSGITMSIAGWLWADLLLGAFVIFAVANTGGPGAVAAVPPAPAVVPATPTPTAAPPPPTAAPTRPPPGVDPLPLELTLAVNGPLLLAGSPAGVAAEQDRILLEATRAVGPRRVAFVLAYGTHQDLATGERLAALASARLRTGVFEGAAIRTFHNQATGDPGTSLLLSVYFYQ